MNQILNRGYPTQDNNSFKLHKWMDSLPKHMRELPLTMLSIPGTHDSASHTMRIDMPISPDNPLYSAFGGLVRRWINKNTLTSKAKEKKLISAWGKCMKHDIRQQLEIGIRYFDFR